MRESFKRAATCRFEDVRYWGLFAFRQVDRATRRAVDECRDARHVRAPVVDIDGTGAYWRVPA